MQNVASVLTDQFPELLARLPAGLDLDVLARETKAIRRERALQGGATLLRLALARGPGGLSLRQTAAWAAMLGIARLSDPAVKYRLDQAVPFLTALTGRLLAAKTPGARLCWPDRTVRIADGTAITARGATETTWRVHGVFDLGRGGFSHLEVTDHRGAEALTRGATQPGEVRIGDRNYARGAEFRRFLQSGAGTADFIVRIGWAALRLSHRGGERFDLIEHLRRLPMDEAPHEIELRADTGTGETPLALRLIIARKPPEAAEAARRSVRRGASKRGKRLDPRSLIAAEFVILATSLPAPAYAAAEVLAAYRLRWQIELAFKRMKSLLHIDKLPTWTERGSLSWLYAHLVLALICDDLSQDLLDSPP